MNIKRRQISFSIMLLTLLTLLVTTFTLTALADGEENPLHAILEKIENAEQYTFDVTSQQTLIPRASATTIGQTNEQLNAYISGNVTGPQQIDLALRIQGMGVNAPPMQLQQDGANLYVLEDGERTLLQAAPTALSGMQNPSAFLASAVNLQPLVTTQAAHAYTFDIDGSRYAAHLAQQASANTPANQHVAPAAQLQNLTGTGEIWLDANGWITRQILDLHIPNVNGDYDMQAHTVIDFTFD
ncbi:MAG: hypothetical protein GY805_12245, partial [Chloroflexi bacterium]|nr:hypothetical protein [Chloroflexota bacterium]